MLKAIDVSGLTFLSPVVRLAYGEEPSVQLKKIFQWIVVPICTILGFLIVWDWTADEVKTKSGSLPDPVQTWKANAAISTFGDYEKDKEVAFSLTGEERNAQLNAAQARLDELIPIVDSANEGVAEAKKAHAAEIAAVVGPMTVKRDQLKAEYKEAKAARKAALDAQSEALTPGDTVAYEAFLASTKEHITKTEEERDTLSALAKEIKELRDEPSKNVAIALAAQTQAAEERQYLEKKIELLSKDNRELKVGEAQKQIDADVAELTTLTGAAAVKKANRIAQAESRIEKATDATYAGPKTLGYQIKRSILCVFTGFFLGSAIAIPIGILCGLNSTFMAAMTPFIAIFKPVSPIVWLPICLIVASSVVPAPEDSSFMEFLWEDMPILHHFDINPAFVASACTVALCSLWATLANTALGVASIDKDHLNVARVLKLGFWPRLFKIVIPSALPLIFAGLRISLGVGWMVLIAAELLSSSEGIGKFVWDQFNNGASDSFAKLFVVVFVVGLIGLALDRIMIVLQRLVSFEGSPASI